MIDTIKGYRNIKPKHYRAIQILIEKSRITTNKKGYNATLNISNFKFTIKINSENRPYKMYFNGSLPKYFFGNNLQHLNMITLKEAIDMLSSEVGINMKKAILTRIDYGYSFEVKHPVNEYLNCLSSYPRFKTMRYQDSITFFTKYASKALIFYDKLKEMKSSDKNYSINLPMNYYNKRIMRYEIRLKMNLRRRFNVDVFKLNTLLNKRVITDIHSNWVSSYKRVQKLEIGLDPIPLIQNYNGLYKYLSFHGINKLGYDRTMNLISNLDFNVKSPAVKRSKLKFTINEILKEANNNLLEKHLIKELDKKIVNFKN